MKMYDGPKSWQDRRRRTELLRQNGGVHESHAEVLLPGEGCRTPAASSFLGEQGTGSRLNTPASLSKQETGKMLYTGPIAWKDKSRSTGRKNIDMNDVERLTVSDHQSTKETVVNGSASPITPPNAGDCRKKSNKPCKKVCVKVDPYMIINPAFNAGNHTPSRETPSSFSSNHAHGVGSHSMEPFALESSTSFEAPKPPNTYFDNPKKTSACCSRTELESYRVNPYKQEELDKQQLKLGNNDPQPQISIID